MFPARHLETGKSNLPPLISFNSLSPSLPSYATLFALQIRCLLCYLSMTLCYLSTNNTTSPYHTLPLHNPRYLSMTPLPLQ